jgi:alpha/beta hydrolase fold/VHL beta domain
MKSMRHCLSVLVVLVLSSHAAIRAAEELREPPTNWKYPPEMADARVEFYRQVGDVKLNAWIFEPKGHAASERRPAIVFFFGGGWQGGTLGQFLSQCRHLAERGRVAITVDYRVKGRPGVPPQECVRDAKAAIRWVRTNASRLGIDPDRIAAVESLPMLDELHPSWRTGEETSLRFIYRTKETIQVFWLDAEGSRKEYAKFNPDEEHEQHTFAGHVWLVTANGKTLGIFEATESAGRAIIDGGPKAETESATFVGIRTTSLSERQRSLCWQPDSTRPI